MEGMEAFEVYYLFRGKERKALVLETDGKKAEMKFERKNDESVYDQVIGYVAIGHTWDLIVG